tara:strand:- start:1075 stop:1644 length:570 start_codon:yes stop_codon:yes gene_type:complete
VIKNKQMQNILSFNVLIPKNTIYDHNINKYEKEEDFVEEIKNITLKGGKEKDNLEEEQVNEDLDVLCTDLVEKTEKVIEENEELSEENKKLEEKNDKLKKKLEDCEDESDSDKESDKEEEKYEFVPVEDEEESEEEFRKKMKGALLHISKQIKEQDGGDEEKKVIYDNISKEGGQFKDENVKNVVVSFF